MNGRMILADPRHEWLVPNTPLSRISGKGARERLSGGKVVLGGPRRIPSEQLTFEDKCWGKGRPNSRFVLSAGEQRSFGMSFRFYHGHKPRAAIGHYEDDIQRTGGLVNVVDSDRNPLQTAGSPVHMDETFDPAERWFPSAGARLDTEGGATTLTAEEPGAGIRTSLTRDFIDVTELRGRVSSLSRRDHLRFTLTGLEDGTKPEIGTVNSAGTFRLNASEAISYRDTTPCILNVTIEGDGPGKAVLERLTLGWITPPAPKLVSPEQDVKLTDLSVSVSIMSQTPRRTETGYRVQIAPGKRFDNPLVDEVFPASMRICGALHSDRTFLPTRLLPEGEYFCRVRGISSPDRPGDWSKVRRFRVTKASAAPLPCGSRCRRRNPCS